LRGLGRPFQEGKHVLYGLLPFHALQPLQEDVPPILPFQLRPVPTGLLKGVVEEMQIGRGPAGIRQKPQEIVEVPALGIPPAENGVQFARQQRGPVIMRQIQKNVPKELISSFCRKNRIRRLSVFGSALGAQFQAESDVDMLVEFEPGQVVGLLKLLLLSESYPQSLADKSTY